MGKDESPNLLVLCECSTPQLQNEQPIETNFRAFARSVFENDEVVREHPWFGLEQEYTLFECDGVTPLGWPHGGFPAPQGQYYWFVVVSLRKFFENSDSFLDSAAGARNAFGRQVVEAHFRACLYSGLTVSGLFKKKFGMCGWWCYLSFAGVNAEVMPGQWEYQIGPVEGIDCADQMWLSRYILERVAEDFGVVVSYAPKPVSGDWNGAGCHSNYSTESMRREGGMEHILEAISKLESAHMEHMAWYGQDNDKRMTGRHETAKFDVFSHGVGHRGTSIRIPNPVAQEGKGYLEDRRPAANMDPYLVTAMLAKTTLLSPENLKTN